MESTRGAWRRRAGRSGTLSAYPWRQSTIAAAILGVSLGAGAQSNPSAPRPLVEEQLQQERERARRQQQEPTLDARLQAEIVEASIRKPEGFRTARVMAGFNLNFGF